MIVKTFLKKAAVGAALFMLACFSAWAQKDAKDMLSG